MQIGGQAVLEGVMMRAPGSVATAVRRANGDIVVKQEPYQSVVEKYPILKLPIVRGAIGLIDMMYLGIKTLNYSAEVAMLDLETEESRKNGSRKKKGQSTLALVSTLVLALALGIGIFFVVPIVVTTNVFGFEQQALAFNLTAGIIRIDCPLKRDSTSVPIPRGGAQVRFRVRTFQPTRSSGGPGAQPVPPEMRHEFSADRHVRCHPGLQSP
jgi:uncharacterized protein YqhQ